MLSRITKMLFLCVMGTFMLSASHAQSVNAKYRLRLKAAERLFAPNFSTIQSAAVPPSEQVAGRYYRFLQFYEIPSPAELAQMKSLGVRFLNYIPNYAYTVSLPANFDVPALAPFGVRGLYPIAAAYKIDPLLSGPQIPDWAAPVPGELDLILKYYKDISPETMRQILNDLRVERLDENEMMHWVKVRTTPDRLKEIAALNFVTYAGPVNPPGIPEDDRGRSLHRANMLNSAYAAGRHYDGAGVNVGLNDDGFVGPHIDFTGRTDQTLVAGDMTGSHGDMTGGIWCGAGNLDPTIQGMAPGAFMYVDQYDADMLNSVNMITNNTVRIFSTSYHGGCNVGYNTVAQQIDFENDTFPATQQVFSAGNQGNTDCGYGAGGGWGNITGGHKTAKSAIACANLFADDSKVTSSSQGPATDGRIKPDISANGQDQLSTDPDNQYSPGGGTSAASPGVAGILTDLMHAYRDLNAGNEPDNALLKMVLLNTADDLGNVGPDFTFGWGRVNGGKAVEVLEDGRYFTDSVAQSGTNNHAFSIPAGTQQMRVMVYWRDPAGALLAAPSLVNDLNIQVLRNSDGMQFDPWLLDHTPTVAALTTPATTGRDSVNNMEQVAIDTPQAGNYTLLVSGFAVPQGPQQYWVTYEYATDTPRITYPLGGEGFDPGETQRVRWDAAGNTGTFMLEYSTDNGVVWNTVSASIPATDRFWDWQVPNGVTTGQAWMRITRNGITGSHPAPFSIIDIPQGLQITFVCPDSIGLQWNASAGATEYEVSMLGTMYMDSVGRTTSTNYTFYNLVPVNENWFSVRALGANGASGRRANAIANQPGVANCAIPLDANIPQITAPVGGKQDCYDNSATVIAIDIQNSGISSISNFPVSYQINGGSVVTETYSGTVTSGQTTSFSFSQTADLSTPGNYAIVAWADLSGDGNEFNDTATGTFGTYASTLVSLPFSDDFEGFQTCPTTNLCGDVVCNLSNGWINEENNVSDDHDWRADTDGTPSNSTGPTTDHNPGNNNGIYLYTEASGNCTNLTASLLSPCFDLSNTTDPEFSFWYHMDGGTMGSLHVDVFDGQTWTMDVTPAISGSQGTNWQNRSFYLSAWAGGTVTVRFRGITGFDFASDMAIDDISFTNDTLVAVSGGVEAPEINVFPNPTEGLLHVSMGQADQDEVQLEVMNLMMQQVFQAEMRPVNGRFETKLDLSNLTRGVYFLRAKTKAYEKVVKIELL